jgi:hypothetical protein
VPKRTIFRESAIEVYRRGIAKDVVPRLIAWPIVVCLWLLLGVFLAAGFLAWYIQVPTHVDASGIILAPRDLLPLADGETVALVFLPPDHAARVRVGLPTDIQIGSGGVYTHGTLAKIEPGIISPNTARTNYRLDGVGGLVITEPSVVAIVRLDTSLPATTYPGSLVTAKIEIGSQRLLALLPGIRQLLGGGS